LTSSLALYSDLAQIAREWDELADRIGASPFLRPGWFDAWSRAFAPEGLSVLAVQRRGCLTGVVPLRRDHRSLRSATNEHTPEFGFLAEDVEAASVLAARLFSQRPASIRLEFLDDRGGLAECIVAGSAARYRILVQPMMRSPYLDIQGSWEAYRSGLPRKTRHNIDRSWRGLAAQGELALEVSDGSTRLEALLAEGFQIEASVWKAARGTAIVSRPETTSFYREIARWAAGRDMLRLAFLRIDDRAVAFSFGLEQSGVFYVLKGGYDITFARYGPGNLLRHTLIARAFDQGLRRYEFLGSDEPWKRTWTGTTRNRSRLVAFPRSTVGVTSWLAIRYARPFAGRLQAAARRQVSRFRSAQSDSHDCSATSTSALPWRTPRD
jgi:CelD/BcsL family acetyltransferase involved in cellulose biosynthesis